MATIEEIKEIIKAEVNERINVNDIPADDSLEDHGIDSLDRSSIFMTIEDKYGISIPDSDLGKLTTFSNIVTYINQKKEA
jgi:acyl carrier protein